MPLRPPPLQVRTLAPLSSLGSSSPLTELYASCNKIATIEGLERLAHLHILELGGNRVRVLEGACKGGAGQPCLLTVRRCLEPLSAHSLTCAARMQLLTPCV